MRCSRDRQARASVAADSSRVLSVSDATTYIAEHFGVHIDGISTHPLISGCHVRRLLTSGDWPCTRTKDGPLGVTVADLTKVGTGGWP